MNPPKTPITKGPVTIPAQTQADKPQVEIVAGLRKRLAIAESILNVNGITKEAIAEVRQALVEMVRHPLNTQAVAVNMEKPTPITINKSALPERGIQLEPNGSVSLSISSSIENSTQGRGVIKVSWECFPPPAGYLWISFTNKEGVLLGPSLKLEDKAGHKTKDELGHELGGEPMGEVIFNPDNLGFDPFNVVQAFYVSVSDKPNK